MPADTTVSVTLPSDLWFQAEEHARLQHRELSDVLADALSFYRKAVWQIQASSCRLGSHS